LTTFMEKDTEELFVHNHVYHLQVLLSNRSHALSSFTKVNAAGLISDVLSCLLEQLHCLLWLHILCICWKLPIPCENVQCTMPGAIAAISATTHGGFHCPPSQTASWDCLCLKSRYPSFDYNQKSRSSLAAI
jgi:hypothetical protein